MAAPPFNVVANRLGVNRETGAILTDWDHCVQSIWDILTTEVGSRVMLLDYGASPADLLDRPGNQQVIALWYSSIVTAIYRWEPGFRIARFILESAGPDGHYTFDIIGLFYPRGHLGDYSLVEDRTVSFLTNVQDNTFAVVGLVA